MRERPILFSAPMVRAILDGRKTVTRRVVKPQPSSGVRASPFVSSGIEDGHGRELRCPYGQPGERLWVRETFAIESAVEGLSQPLPFSDGRPVQYAPEDDVAGYHPGWIQPHYRATDPAPDLCCDIASCRQCRERDMGPHWKPSIHMPRWASRITLEVTGVRVERLQDISEADAKAEGAPMSWAAAQYRGGTWRQGFSDLWQQINGADSWGANPWVWVVEFRRLLPDNALPRQVVG